MKKIIAAFDGLKFSESTLNYSIYIARETNTHLIGVFLDDPTYHGYSTRKLLSREFQNIDVAIDHYNSIDAVKRDESADQFEKACEQAGIKYTLHRDRNVAIQDLLHESIYADLLIIDSNEEFNRFEDDVPTRFLKDLLSDVQCPVLLVPDIYLPIKKVIILYDGEPTSVYAVKMFSYLLHNLKHLPIEVISVDDDYKAKELPDKSLMKEFMSGHFPKAKYHLLHGVPEEEIVSYIEHQKEYCLTVLGAYRRGRISRWFRPSMADSLAKFIRMPLFIAHNK